MSVGEPLSLGKPAAPSQQSLLALSWLNFFLAGMQTAFGPIAAAYLAAREWTAKDIGFVLSIGPRGGVAGHHRWRPRAGGCCYFPRTGWPRQFGGTVRTEPALRRRRGRRGYPDDGPIRNKLIDHKEFIARYGDDMPEITGWRWGQEAASAGVRSTEADNV